MNVLQRADTLGSAEVGLGRRAEGGGHGSKAPLVGGILLPFRGTPHVVRRGGLIAS